MKQPGLNKYLRAVVIGMVISDATIYTNGFYSGIKFEQSTMQYFFVHHLFYLFKDYTFASDISVRFNSKDKKTIKSFYFKTFTHPTFSELYNIFYINGKKVLSIDLLNLVDEVALAY